LDPRLETNREYWDERVPIHVGSRFYDVDAFRRGADTLRPFEVEEVGEVAGKRLLHLQCHFGLDTLSWARRGASVVGLDFSAPAVEAANGLARESDLDGRFVASDVYAAAEALDGERFEIVYTGLGALNWLPDVEAWARVVASLLVEGGFLYLAEFHPITWALGDEQMAFERDYFHSVEGERFEESGTYAELDAETDHNVTREWNHTLADVIGAVLAAGLRLESFDEHDFTLFPRWAHLQREGGLEAGEIYRQPPGSPSLPLMYSLRARRD